MNHSQSKLKNSTRRYRDDVAVKRQVKIAKQHGYNFNDEVIREPHRLSKRHTMDCGKPHCILCGNPRRNKSLKKKDQLTTQEKSLFQDLENTNDKHSNGLSPDDPNN